jgi:beta-N-acetylhexosaminidase
MNPTLKAKIGQMFMVGFEGGTPTDNILRLIREYQVGGIILFSRNIQSPVQLRDLIHQLQAQACQTDLGLPLLVAIDQEGGIVTRLTRGFTIFPGNMALGAAGSEELAGQAAEVMAREMKAVGIHMNLAPVLDINTRLDNPGIGVRAYGDNPQLVARMGVAMIKAYQQHGIIATAKHFPGKGDAGIDAHLDLPSIFHSRERLEKVELYPFVAALRAGVKAIMTSHVYFPGLEEPHASLSISTQIAAPEPIGSSPPHPLIPPLPSWERGTGGKGKRLSSPLPATLSRAITEMLLRKKLGFQGVVITDDLEMGAILRYFDLKEAVVRAVEAGADLLLICRDYQRQLEGLQGLYRAVEEGRVGEERISASFQRLLSLKQAFCGKRGEGEGRGETPPWMDQVGTAENRRVAYEVARRAITLVRNRRGLIPLNTSQYHRPGVLYPKVFTLTQVEEGPEPVTLFSEFRQRYPQAVGFEFDTEPSPDQIQQACAVGREADFILIGSYNGHLKSKQKQLIQELIALQKPIVLMALRNPYDIGEFPEIETCLALYDYHRASIVAGIQVLMGDIQAVGRLPVTLNP